jgi:outer membrane protein assembly factor BamE (lipoprotein component of BamABCDE complex)
LTVPRRDGIERHMDRPRPSVNAASGPRRPLRAALALAAVLVATGCTLFQSPVIARGNRPTEAQIKDISVGVHTRADVQALLGSPTSTSAFGDQSWYYISARTRLRPMQHFGITDPETVAVDFDDRGTVKQVRVLTETDMPRVSMVSRETPTPGNERTLMQALFGNIGRVSPVPTDTTPGVQSGSSSR